MSPNKKNAGTLALFCKVIDNYGDIGICWRLARQLQHEHGVAVTLWVDDLASFKRICPALAGEADVQMREGVEVRHWRDQDGAFTPDQVADIVIEFFACDIPPGYIAAMAQRTPRPVWLNLEGLSAEEWVEGCHTLPSPHPRLPLTKHFFFPGFTGKTGGLLREAALDAERERFQAAPARVADFLAGLGVSAAEQLATRVSLFCYPEAPVEALFGAWCDGRRALTCLVPEGVAPAAVQAFLEGGAKAGAARTRGALTVRVIPFVAQPDYDKLLWACDLNFVRGEDSFVRAQWAGKPFIWHIYPQDENLHHKKLRAFLARYEAGPPAALSAFADFSLAWNGAGPAAQAGWPLLWTGFEAGMAELASGAPAWQRQMRENGDLAGNLLAFATALGS
ncbi:MAG: elongation factor P maturation arginine rhamnosyltransferase EarP [Pseudomonadota bacterium]